MRQMRLDDGKDDRFQYVLNENGTYIRLFQLDAKNLIWRVNAGGELQWTKGNESDFWYSFFETQQLSLEGGQKVLHWLRELEFYDTLDSHLDSDPNNP